MRRYITDYYDSKGNKTDYNKSSFAGIDFNNDEDSILHAEILRGNHPYKPVINWNDGSIILPEVTVTAPAYADMFLTTYYPGGGAYPFTGHSELKVNYRDSNIKGGYEIGRVDTMSDDKGYNLIISNCANDTIDALQSVFGKTSNYVTPITPGNSREFAEKNGMKRIYNGTFSTVDHIRLNPLQIAKYKKFIKNYNKKRDKFYIDDDELKQLNSNMNLIPRYLGGKPLNKNKYSTNNYFKQYGINSDKFVEMFKALKKRGLTNQVAFEITWQSLKEVPKGYYSFGTRCDNVNTWADNVVYHQLKRGVYKNAKDARTYDQYIDAITPAYNSGPNYKKWLKTGRDIAKDWFNKTVIVPENLGKPIVYQPTEENDQLDYYNPVNDYDTV